MDPTVQEVLAGAILVGALGYLLLWRRRPGSDSGCASCHACEDPPPPERASHHLPQAPTHHR